MLVPVRGWLNTRLPEPAGPGRELAKQALLWVGLVLLVYGFVALFDGQARTVHYGGYFNFWWAVWVSALGFVILVPLRTVTLREELRGRVAIMTGTIANLSDEQRRMTLAGRPVTIAGMPGPARRRQMQVMAASDGQLRTAQRTFHSM